MAFVFVICFLLYISSVLTSYTPSKRGEPFWFVPEDVPLSLNVFTELRKSEAR